MKPIELLTNFGLTRQEAAVYTALYEKGNITGYEAAKLAGISRSNAYAALAGLVEKGAVYRVEDTAVRYTPVAVEQFCGNKLHRLEEMAKELTQCMPAKTEEAGYLTISGGQNIRDEMGHLIDQAEKRLYLVAFGQLLEQLRPCLERAIARGLKVVVLAPPAFQLRGAKVYYREQCSPEQIRLITDSVHALTGEIRGEDGVCLLSKRKNLVDLIKESLKNEIRLLKLEGKRA